MRYVQFFTRSALSPTQLVEAHGMKGVAKLDQRHALKTSALIARSLCRVREFAGFEIRDGKSYSQATCVRKLERI